MAEIASASSARQWRIAVAVAGLALESLSIRHPQLVAALAEIRSGRRDPATRRIVADVADDLDRQYLAMHDDEQPGGPSAGWESAFSAARAAASLGFAFDSDPRTAAIEAAYEALHAIGGDEAALRTVVLATV